MSKQKWQIYLSGEIHTKWRNEIARAIKKMKLPINIVGPQLNHKASDKCGDLLGPEENKFWHDHRSAKINTIHNKTLLDRSDLVIVKFGDKYKQWNAAFDAGQAAALGKSIITLHDESLDHALKEIDATALAVTRTVAEVTKVLKYVTK